MKKGNFIFIIFMLIIIIGLFQLILHQTKDNTREEMDYAEYGSSDRVIIMIHGSPGSKDDFNLLAPSLQNKYKIYALDMPCFGNSPMESDCGIVEGANTINDFMLQKGIEKANIIGYSWGGGVAIEFAYSYPEKTNSLILLSSMGIQEGEFIPNHNLEKLYALVTYPFVVYYPGAFAGDIKWRRGFMKSFIQTDLRPLREHMQSINAINTPTLILHGNKDTNIEPSTAMIHHELIKNSDLVFFNGTHITLFNNVSEISPILYSFLLKHEKYETQATLNLIIEQGEQQ